MSILQRNSGPDSSSEAGESHITPVLRSRYWGSGHSAAENAIGRLRRPPVPKQPPGDDNVGRMQFLLGLRKRGISDPAVLRAMDEVPREHFVENAFIDNAHSRPA